MVYPFAGDEFKQQCQEGTADWPLRCQGQDWRDFLSPAECCLAVSIEEFARRMELPPPWPEVLKCLEQVARARQKVMAEAGT
jgi:hypothetical protein